MTTGTTQSALRVAPCIEVLHGHVTRAEVSEDGWEPRTGLVLLPTSRRVQLESNPDVVVMVKGRYVPNWDGDGRNFVRADARNSEWIGVDGGCYVFGLAEQLEAEGLFLEGL